QPTGLEPRERVWLVIEGVDARGAVALNGQLLGEVPGYALPTSFDVTGHLLPRNELEIVAETPPRSQHPGCSQQPGCFDACLRPGRDDQPGGPVREVRLEVRHQNYLQQLTTYAANCHGQATLRISATAAGPEV